MNYIKRKDCNSIRAKAINPICGFNGCGNFVTTEISFRSFLKFGHFTCCSECAEKFRKNELEV